MRWFIVLISIFSISRLEAQVVMDSIRVTVPENIDYSGWSCDELNSERTRLERKYFEVQLSFETTNDKPFHH